jgi:integrase/recombinase XerC
MAFSRAYPGHRLNGSSIDRIVSTIAKQAGIGKRISPHRLRHSSITAFLDASGGKVRAAQRLSRHLKLDTLQIYDDNRQDIQGEASELLASLRG